MDMNFCHFDPSLALAAITACDSQKIQTRTKADLPPWLALEALMQTCGLHLRHMHAFRIQTYLVSVADIVCTPNMGTEALLIEAILDTQTTAAARYTVRLPGSPQGCVLMGYHPDTTGTILQTRFERLCRTPSWNV